MDRRTFLTGTFGLVVLTAGVGLGGLAGCGSGASKAAGSSAAATASTGGVMFTTPATGEPETATGPLMMAGIDLVEVPDADRIAAYYDGAEVFNMNAAGAALIMLADGVRTIDEITDEALAEGHVAEPADVALFFSSLCEAGYLRNRVLVSIME